MDVLSDSVFWLSSLFVAYPYVIYPALMAAIGKLWPVPRPKPGELPYVSVIVAAYNEAKWIGRKIESTMSQDYPPERLEVIVVSDGSTDSTDKIVMGFKDPRVKLFVQEERKGKSMALNRGVGEAKGQILVFTDANALFGPGSIMALAEHFSDPTVGLVSGQGLYAGDEHNTSEAVANGYVHFETLIKTGESLLGFIGGADGAIYGIRRELYQDLAAAQVNDLLHPIMSALAGYSSRFDSRAYTVEPPSNGVSHEFHRHVRIIAQGFAIVFKTLPRLVAQGQWKEVWMLCSHRLFRWVSLIGFVGLLATSVFSDGDLYKLALVSQGCFYTMVLTGWFTERMKWRSGVLSTPYYFCTVCAAGLVGFWRFLQGGAQAVWNPTSNALSEKLVSGDRQ